ncbi:MAG: class I SAM-dependent methyltransferase [Bacillota bacterium]|nr:class I SAM-dependent methyltransferase [Bacillota bacterium]
MFDLFKFKTLFFSPLVRFIVKHPNLMRSRLFLKAMRVFPEKISENYDEKITKNMKKYQISILEGLNKINNDPKKILDACTGTGLAAFLAADCFIEASVEAIDQSSKMIEVAKLNAIEKSINRINFKEGNAINLSHNNETFDLFISSNAPIYLSEASRVLKTKGVILVSFSFGGKAISKAERYISDYLLENNIKLLELKSSGDGVYIIGQKF